MLSYYAGLVWKALAGVKRGLTLGELETRTGLSDWQVRYGLSGCRSFVQRAAGRPVAWQLENGRYILPDAWRPYVTEYADWNLRYCINRLTNCVGETCAASVTAWSEPEAQDTYDEVMVALKHLRAAQKIVG